MEFEYSSATHVYIYTHNHILYISYYKYDGFGFDFGTNAWRWDPPFELKVTVSLKTRFPLRILLFTVSNYFFY